LWRREINKVGQGGHYRHSTNPGLNTLVIERHESFEGIASVFSARSPATISPLTAEHLTELAIESARREKTWPRWHQLPDRGKAKRNRYSSFRAV
jgi:hypothetical protein